MSKFAQALRRFNRRGVIPAPGGGQFLSVGCIGNFTALFWTPISPLPDSWLVFRAIGGAGFLFLFSVPGSSLGGSDIHSACPGATQFDYQVFAVNAGGVGPGSNVAGQLANLV
jgi:hypothetical protein